MGRIRFNMKILKNKCFDQWAKKECLTDETLIQAVLETVAGQYEAYLGAYLYKKRVALPGRGKRGGARTIIAVRRDDRAFFIYGFAKNAKASTSSKELEALKDLARDYLNHDEVMIKRMLKEKLLIEVLL